jgi:tetratricopeptide (TPR) repeat protein
VAHLNSAASYYCIGDLEQAFLGIDAYDEICRDHGDEVDRLQWYNVLFLLYEYNKDYANAKATLEKSIDLGIEAGKFNIASYGYSNYIHLLLEEKNFPEALTMATMGLEMAKLHTPPPVPS